MALRDLRYALRSLARSPGYAVVAVLSLGLGLGLVTTMFAILDATTHPWVPFRDADRLYAVRFWMSGTDQRFSPGWALTALRARTHAFEAVLPYGVSVADLSGEGGGEAAEDRDVIARAPVALLRLLDVKPVRGRMLGAADIGRGTALVSDALWKRRFAGRRSLAGATIAIGDRTYAVVGVMPASGASYVFMNASAWLPLPDSLALGPREFDNIIVKLRRGVTREAATAELTGVAAYLTRTYHAEGAPFAFYLWPLRNDPMRLGDVHWAMLGAAVAVLLIACANLAHLMLARGLARRREVALRLAIGASRTAVVRHLFLECALLTGAGAALGAALSVWGVEVLRSSVPQQLWWRGIVRPELSWRVFALTSFAAATAAVLFGLLPAVRVARAVSLDEPLKDGAGTTSRTRQRYSGLVIAEVALALVLLMGAGLLLKVVRRTASYEFNFPARQLLRSGLFLRKAAAGGGFDLLGTELRVVASLRQVPGVVDAGATSSATPAGLAVTAELAGDSTRLFNTHSYAVVTPAYLRTMGLPVLEGRDFEDGDLTGEGVAILNSVAAARLYPRQHAVGRMVKLGVASSNARWLKVVGVCRTRAEGPPGTAEFNAEVYVVRPPEPGQRFAEVLIRTAGTDARTIAAVSAKLATLGPGIGSYVSEYLSWWEADLKAQGFLAELFAMMGGFALLLASVGIYGVLAYAVNRRGREFAVRIAVGAERRDMLKLVLHDGLVMTLAGTALGAFVAFWATGLLAAFLEDQQVLPTDVLTLIAAEVVLIAVATAASLAPALRAMRADPIEILRAT
ncbi:MAG TPA: ABC transporter permease [Gemmatimonadales bacterium]|nr:ABC transporter permease [Gemmatimonadales bacterium]